MNDTKHNDEIVLCRRFYDDVAANLALGALRENGIPSTIDNQIFSSVYPLGMSSLGALRLMVFGKDLQRANEIIDLMHLDCF